MKNGLFLFLVISIVFGACSDDDLSTQEQADVDLEIIQDYIASNNLDAIEHPSGVFYVIDKEGTGDTHPSLFSEVQVEYKGYLADGTVFDQTSPNNPIIFPLTNVILGWQEGIPVFKKGGEGILLIPSRLGYGRNARSNIPANSVLIFDIKLIDFN